jgi:DNA-binding beta-propeller fold protein YncE
MSRSISLAATLLLSCVSGVAHPASGIAAGPSGDVYFVDTARGVFEIQPTGELKQLNNNNEHWLALDPDGRFGKAGKLGNQTAHIYRATPENRRPAIFLSSGAPLAIGPDGNIYYAPYAASEPLRFLRRTPDGESVLATVAKSTDGQALQWINGIAARPDGTIYFTENDAVRKISAKGALSTVVSGLKRDNVKPAPGIGAHLGPFLRGLAVDGHGNLLVAASGSCAVLKITPAGGVTNIVQTESPWSPTGVAVNGDTVYVLEYRHTASDVREEWLPRVRKISADGKQSIIAKVEN